MSRGRAAAAALACVALGGCGGGGGHEPPARSDARLIRGWIAALDHGDYGRAAAYFAPGAIVEQTDVVRLPDRRAAEAFNRGLPCRADVTDVKREDGTTVAAFRLRRGPGPPDTCGGFARVRFRIRDGRFTEWRQLPEPAPPVTARAPGRLVSSALKPPASE